MFDDTGDDIDLDVDVDKLVDDLDVSSATDIPHCDDDMLDWADRTQNVYFKKEALQHARSVDILHTQIVKGRLCEYKAIMGSCTGGQRFCLEDFSLCLVANLLNRTFSIVDVPFLKRAYKDTLSLNKNVFHHERQVKLQPYSDGLANAVLFPIVGLLTTIGSEAMLGLTGFAYVFLSPVCDGDPIMADWS